MLESRQLLAFGRNNFAIHQRRGRTGQPVEHANFHPDLRLPGWNVILKFRPDINPVRRDGHRRGLVQPDMPVDARTFVKPAFRFRRIHPHGNRVPAAVMRHVRNVLAERIVAALVMAHAPAVDPYRRVAEHPVEGQPDALSLVRLRQFKRPAIPRDAVGRILYAQGVKAMAAVGGPVERQFHRPIVRHIDGTPKGVVKSCRCRPRTGAGIFQVQRIRPVVTQVEFPVGIQRKVLGWQIGGGQRRNPQPGTHAGK